MKPFNYYLHRVTYNFNTKSALFLTKENENPKEVISKILGDELKSIDEIRMIRKYGE
jgi:hypothetical protein